MQLFSACTGDAHCNLLLIHWFGYFAQTGALCKYKRSIVTLKDSVVESTQMRLFKKTQFSAVQQSADLTKK